MGKFNKGLLGPYSGAVGPVVGSSWKDVAYMRSKPLIKKRKSTEDQVDHQLKFSTVFNFVNVFTTLIRITFKKYAVNMSPNNAAVAYNYRHAVSGKELRYVIDFAKALVSRGSLPNASHPEATVTGGEVFFKWINNSQVSGTTPEDSAILIAYCPNLNQSIFTTASATRMQGSATLDVSPFTGETIHTWIAFSSALDAEDVSDSTYTGQLVVS